MLVYQRVDVYRKSHTWHQRPPSADVNARTECPWHKRLRSNGHVEARIARVAKARRVGLALEVWHDWFGNVSDYTNMDPGWWFGTFFIFPYIGNNHPN